MNDARGQFRTDEARASWQISIADFLPAYFKSSVGVLSPAMSNVSDVSLTDFGTNLIRNDTLGTESACLQNWRLDAILIGGRGDLDAVSQLFRPPKRHGYPFFV